MSSAREGRMVFVLGAGGHASVVVDVLQRAGVNVGACIDPAVSERGRTVLGVPVSEVPPSSEYPCTHVVAIGDNYRRERVADQYHGFFTAVHPRAVVAYDAVVGDGTVIMAGALVNPGVRIGRHCIVNTGSVIEHDCVLEDFASVGPNATLSGRVHVGARTAIGVAAVVRERILLGSDTVVGAGAVVVDNLPDCVLAVGVPARPVRERTPGESYLK